MVLLSGPSETRLELVTVSPLAIRALPHILVHAHVVTPRKWLATKTPVATLGRPRSLELAAVLALADVALQLCPWMPTWRHLASIIASVIASSADAITWVLFKKPKGELGKEWPEAAKRTLRELCQQKFEWTLNDAAITDRSRIINIDETCCKTSPLLERGWLVRQAVMDTRRNIAVFLATRYLVPDVYAQLIFQGKTSAVGPANPYPSQRATGRLQRPSLHSSHGWIPQL